MRLKSGNAVSVSSGILGIGADGVLYGGYDHPLGANGCEDWEDPRRGLTADDVREIAAEAIRRWTALVDSL